MSIRNYVAGVLILASACSSDTTAADSTNTVDPTLYSGTWTGGQSAGGTVSGTISFHIVGGTLTGEVAPMSGSKTTLTGTVSGSGAISATVPAETAGCAVTLAGQVPVGATGPWTATGTYTLVQSTTCNTASGTWTATRPAS